MNNGRVSVRVGTAWMAGDNSLHAGTKNKLPESAGRAIISQMPPAEMHTLLPTSPDSRFNKDRNSTCIDII